MARIRDLGINSIPVNMGPSEIGSGGGRKPDYDESTPPTCSTDATPPPCSTDATPPHDGKQSAASTRPAGTLGGDDAVRLMQQLDDHLSRRVEE